MVVTLNLTEEEAFMLRDLTTGTDCGYEWSGQPGDEV